MNSVVWIVAWYIAMQLLADISVLKVVQIGAFTAAAGIFTYPITFTLRDMAHKVLGRKQVRQLVLAAGAVNLFMGLLFWFIAKLPLADPNSVDSWAKVLAPVWRIVLASIVAEVFAELLDTEVYHLWVSRVTRRYQWLRVLVSNTVSLPLDALIFVWLAFGGVLPNEVVWAIWQSNLLAKFVTTVIGLPLIYLVPEKSEAQ
jgi:queuosine precursor transporter